MIKERGLLNLCAVAFKARNICPFLLTEISELLAQPEQKPTTRHALDSYWNQEAYQRGYARAELDLKREPLSEEAVSELLMGGFSTHLMDLVRMLEKAHGIGGEI